MIQVYHSIFAELIQDFIAYKRAAGYNVNFANEFH